VSRARSWGILWRQLTAHRAFAVRRALAEGAATLLSRADRVVPGAAHLALRLHPLSAAAHCSLELRALRRGDAGEARRHGEQARRLARNTLETPVLATLRGAVAGVFRRRVPRVGRPPDVAPTDRLEERLRWAGELDAPLPARIAALLELARDAEERADRGVARRAIEQALELDRGRAELWRKLGELSLAEGERSGARSALERATALDPGDVKTLLHLGDACAEDDPGWANRLWLRALERGPDLPGVLERLEGLAATPPEGRLEIEPDPPPSFLEPDEAAELTIRVRTPCSGGSLWILEPFGAGLLCSPRGRIPLHGGDGEIHLEVLAARPDSVNCGRPWIVHLALCTGGMPLRAQLSVAVPDRAAGRIHYVITEDHELYDEREATSATDARVTLVDKSRLAERIANQQGARWTHMVDVGSLALVRWAAERSPEGAWPEVHRLCEEHLVEAVLHGNDLGLHLHAFHDPDFRGFVHDFDDAADAVSTGDDLLNAAGSHRGYWSRAYPALGDVDEPDSRAGATWKGIGQLEALGRLGDPHFRVTLFRAGSFDLGDDAAERARSLALLARLGLLADSDVRKPRLYHRFPERSPYPASEDPQCSIESPVQMRLLEVPPEFNIESDFLSDLVVLNRYLERRVERLRDRAGEVRAGVHVICAMTHDKFINWRMGRRWDSLDPDYGDWLTIRQHLSHARQRHPELRFSTAREAVLDWYDEHAPELLAWRDEEIVVLSRRGDESETFRYVLRLLARDVPVSPERPRCVRTILPAWPGEGLLDAWVERDGERWASQRSFSGPPWLEFQIDDRGCAWELIVRVAAGSGISVEVWPEEPGILRLDSALGYRNASVEVPPALCPDGARRRVRGVRLKREGTRYIGKLDLTAEGDQADHDR
jgi:tetratricopeptide (TPR) repeat protein